MKLIAKTLSNSIKLFVWIVTVGGYLPILRAAKSGVVIEEEIVFCVDPAFFTWPIWLIGFIGNFVMAHWKGTSPFFGWVWNVTLLYIFVAVLTNLNALKIVIWGFVVGFFLILSKYMETNHHIPLLSPIFTHLHNLHPKMDPGTASFISWMLLLLWVGTVIHAVASGCKKFTPNQIMEVYAFESGNDMVDRSGKHFVTRYNDILESVLGIGSGDMLITDDNGRVIKEFRNILGLFLLWPRIQEILEQRVTTVDNSARDAANVREVNVQAALDARRAAVAPPTTAVITTVPTTGTIVR